MDLLQLFLPLLTLAAFVTIGPGAVFAEDAATRSARLKWQAVEGAAQYDVQVSRAADMQKVIAQKRLKETAVQLPIPPGTYYYRLRGIDTDGNPGPWSDVDAFAVNERPPMPILPTEKTDFNKKLADEGIKFTWEKGQSKSKYRIEIRDKFGVVIDRVVDDEEFVWSPINAGLYRWRVGYDNKMGVEWGPSRLFMVRGEAIALPPEVEKKIKEMGPQNKAFDTGGEPAYYLIARPGIGMSIFSMGMDSAGDGNVTTANNGSGGGPALASFFNAEFRWRAARKPTTQWLLSGSVNLEMVGMSAGDTEFYCPSLFTRFFYTFRSPNSSWRVGPFLHLQYGSTPIVAYTQINANGTGSGEFVDRTLRMSAGLGGAAIVQVGTSNFLSLLAMARYDFGNDSNGGNFPGDLAGSFGAEFGLGILFSLSPRWIAESRLRAGITQMNSTGAVSATPTAVTRTSSNQVYIDIGIGYQL